jgi:hypothetical protein
MNALNITKFGGMSVIIQCDIVVRTKLFSKSETFRHYFARVMPKYKPKLSETSEPLIWNILVDL